jgi:hypothetical protein
VTSSHATAGLVHVERPRDQNLQRVLSTWALMLLVFGFCAARFPSSDTWWHLATGRWIVAHHAVPHTDPFSFTVAGKRWIAHEYAADTAMYLLYRAGGFPALVAANTALLALAFWFVYRRCRSFAIANALALLLGIWAARVGFALRPQTISFLMGAVYLWILDRYKRTRHWHWLAVLPLLMLVWLQLHAGYVLGLALIGLTLLAEALDWAVGRGGFSPKDWSAPLIALAACVAVVPLNPNGFALFRFPVELLRMKVNEQILEWQPAPFHDARYWPFLALAILTLLAIMFSAQKYRPGQFLLFVVFLSAALKSRRNIPVFVLIAVPLLAEHVRLPGKTYHRGTLRLRSGQATTQRKPMIVFSVGSLLMAAMICAWQTYTALQSQSNAEARVFPSAAVQYLSEHDLPGNLINAYGFGGYLIWRLPERKVFVDGRADMYGDKFLEEYTSVYAGHSLPDPLLDRYQVRTAILEPHSGLAGVLNIKTGNGSWKKVYEDDKAVTFVRIQHRGGAD